MFVMSSGSRVVETLEEARQQLAELRAEAHKKGWDWGFEIARA